jgi:hypothetical protein
MEAEKIKREVRTEMSAPHLKDFTSRPSAFM